MKYLIIARGFNEPDNNTPSDIIWARVAELEPNRIDRYEELYKDDFKDDYEHGVEVDIRPLVEFENEWVKVSEIW